VKAALLDFYGTLAEATSWGPRFEEIITAHNLVWPGERPTIAALDGVDHRVHSVDRDTYVQWERSRLQALAEAAGAEVETMAGVVDALYSASKSWEIVAYPEVPDVLRELRARGVRIVICSNWDWDLPDAVSAAGLDDLIDVIVTSARAGYRKPHPAFYTHALEVAAVRAADSVFAGDSWGPDVEGPLAAGIPVVAHIHRPGDTADQPDLPDLPAGAHRLTDLRGLLDLIG
jgi:putative hydrolase of the HAD superfamily